MSIRERVYHFIEPDHEPGRIVDVAIIVLILLNIVALILETVEPIYNLNRAAFELFEDFSLTVFAIEYLIRLWAITANPRFSHPVTGRIRFVLTPLAIIDFLAILPLFLPPPTVDARFIRVIRVIRIFRVLKLVRYFRALRLLGHVIADRKEELVSIFLVLLILLAPLLVADVPRRARGPARGLYQHPGHHVVEHRHLDHGWLRRHLSNHRPRPDHRRGHRHLGGSACSRCRPACSARDLSRL